MGLLAVARVVLAMTTHVRMHTEIGFANPHMRCDQCCQPTPSWHDGEACGCEQGWWNNPCGHCSPIYSACPSWSPVDGCLCATTSGRRVHQPPLKEEI